MIRKKPTTMDWKDYVNFKGVILIESQLRAYTQLMFSKKRKKVERKRKVSLTCKLILIEN